MKRALALFLSIALVLLTAHRLPAPIQEVTESPTPAPAQSAKPKPKRTIKPKVTESSTKPRTPSPQPKSQLPANRNQFDGTWVGTLHGLPSGDNDYTMYINGAGTTLTEKSAQFGTLTWSATCNGVSMIAKTNGGCVWTLTPNPDGKTMLATATCPGFLGIGAGTWSATFHRSAP